MGSSPHMRGTLRKAPRRMVAVGIIPAYAGNTRGYLDSRLQSRDHPRICGEHLIFDRWPVRVTGSSPHMRGTRNRLAPSPVQAGIIPAYAGNTFFPARTADGLGDHPRICGEHAVSRLTGRLAPGSSPHMRGTRTPRPVGWPCDGIIPAYAGNTSAPSSASIRRWDHPRICGEHSSGIGMIRYGTGSSPHMRGTRAVWMPPTSLRWIIPAYAGNTFRPRPYSTRSRDHPRICGEHIANKTYRVSEEGSSPHMRGTPSNRILPSR